MTTTNHALTGALIATVIKQPFLAIPLAFLSHFVCDALPHFGINMKFRSREMYIWLVVDGLVALTFALFLIFKGVEDPVLLAIAGFAAMSPDLAWLYYGIKGVFPQKEKFGIISRFHNKIQWSETKWGIILELLWAVIVTAAILHFQ